MPNEKQIDDGGPAFPSHPDSAYAGMTLRDWFAGMALQGLLTNNYARFSGASADAFMLADLMLKEREANGSGKAD